MCVFVGLLRLMSSSSCGENEWSGADEVIGGDIDEPTIRGRHNRQSRSSEEKNEAETAIGRRRCSKGKLEEDRNRTIPERSRVGIYCQDRDFN